MNNAYIKSITQLYKATKDGFAATDFHQRCDNKGATLCIIENTIGYTFGGFTTLMWDRSGKCKQNDPCAFIFSINNKKKYKCTDQSSCIGCHPSYGITFGGGLDIYIADNSASNKSSHC